jgi:glycosyltransferase involved in cell wall biosynthesis
MPTVSVAATVLNEAQDIDALVGSLMEQSLAPAEVVIVDGGSTDGTWERLLAAKERYPNLVPIRDETCNFKKSPGPIARGRNVAIATASSEVIACADAGCVYLPDWLEKLTAPILNGSGQYALGGSCLDLEHATVWDIAAAPFFGIKMSPEEPTKSCTARSMAFRKDLWRRIGGFSETVFLGEDTMFDLAARKITQPAFSERAKAFYRPRFTLKSALKQMANYAITDGVLRVRPVRLIRNVARPMVEALALVPLFWTPIPLLCVLALETYFAFRLDWRHIRRAPPRVWIARWLFSLIVPWVVAWNQIAGRLSKRYQLNRQNTVAFRRSDIG